MSGHHVERFPTPPSEPYCYWLRCECGQATSMHRTVAEALAELDQLHTRKQVAA